MSTSLSPRTLGLAAAPSTVTAIPFSRLVRVEWTKATDTRAARWLLALVAVSTIGLVLAALLAPTRFDQTYAGYLEVASIAQVILVPIVAMLMLTCEWSHRTVMTTFTQEPRRLRVVAAKVSAALMLGGLAAVLGGAVAAAGIGLAEASGRHLQGSLGPGDVVGYLVYLLLNVLGGVAFGVLLQSSATAIAAYFSLNAAVALLGTTWNLLAEWVDTATTWTWVLDNDWDGHVLQILVSTLVWVVLPIAAGAVRTVRRDIG